MKLNAKTLALAALSLVLGFAACSNGDDEEFFPPEALEPKIVTVSEDAIVQTGMETTLSVDARTDDSGTLTYQWFSTDAEGAESVAIDGATEAEHTLTIADAGVYHFYCEVTNRLGESERSTVSPVITVTAQDAVVTNARMPIIITHPSDARTVIPASLTLTAGGYAEDGGAITYQWHSVTDSDDPHEIEGATESTYTAEVSRLGKIGYFCVITNTIEDNGDGGVKSASARTETAWIEAVSLGDVLEAPVFTEQPARYSLLAAGEGMTLTCRAEVANYGAVYRWFETDEFDSKPRTAVTGGWSSSPDFEVAPFAEEGIRYFVCAALSYVPSDDSDDGILEKAAVSDVAAVACTGLPTMYLDLDRPLASVTKDDYALGKMRIVQPDGTEFEYEFTKSGKEGIKGRGNYTWSLEKKGYNIKFDKKQEFFGLPAAKKWCITANHADKTLLRNKFASDVLGNEILGNAGGEWSPHFMSVDVVVNGEYRGNYLFGERITLTEGRVDVQDISEVKKDKNGDGAIDLYDGGFIMEIDSRRDADFWFYSEQGLPFTLKDPDEVDTDIQEHIKKIVNTAENAIFSDNFADEAEGYAKYIDVDSFIDWYIVNELTKNLDAAFNTSVYMYYSPEDGKLHMGPNWDFDVSCGATKNNDCYLPEGWYVRNAEWFEQLFKDTNFTDRLKTRWNTVRADIKRAINTEIPSLVDKNRVSANLNFTKWNILGTYFPNGIPGYETRTTYQSEVDWMADWLARRYDWLDGAINGL